jgi:hypothetical protein
MRRLYFTLVFSIALAHPLRAQGIDYFPLKIGTEYKYAFYQSDDYSCHEIIGGHYEENSYTYSGFVFYTINDSASVGDSLVGGSVLLPVHAGGAGEQSLPQGFVADKVVVYKKLRELRLLKGSDTVKTYWISLGANPIGHKERQGDGRTPEGSYIIDWRKSNSAFHLALHISYPDSSDKARAERRGISAGGMIMIHGLPNGFKWNGSPHPLPDWTDGCIAVSNSEIEELWRCIHDGTKILLLP